MLLSDNPQDRPKLLFLDVDGVLNRWTIRPSPRLIEPECAEHLNAILDETGAKIVVSSSLRHVVHSGEMTARGLEYLLRSHGVRCSIIGVTEADDEATPISRWQQIRRWRKANDHAGRCVILDDEDIGMTPVFTRRFVQVNGSKGLTAEDARKAIEILNG